MDPQQTFEAATESRRRYRILGTIGQGGFGTVYRALLLGEGGFSKVVALKVLNADVSEMPEVAERMRDEARVLGLVQHRAVVQVDALVKLHDRWTIVMECVNGIDLKKVVKEGPFPLGPALEIVTEVASALRAAQEQPGPDGQPLALLHRDIKPSNLQLTPAGEVKVLDFGTARANFAAREAKTVATAFGTLDYMAPERLEFIDIPPGDVYSLGTVLYEMLIGTPFGRSYPRPTRHAKKLDEAVQAMQQAGVDYQVVSLLVEMLAFEHEERPTLRQVETRCRNLRAQAGEPWLADWCAQIVPALLARKTMMDADDLVGEVLEEGGSSSQVRRPGGDFTDPMVEPQPTLSRERPVPWLAFAVLVGVLLCALGLVSLVGALILVPRLFADGTEPVEVGVPTADEAPAPDDDEPVDRASRRRAPRTGTIAVEGDAEEVSLIGSNGNRYRAGTVGPGTYTIEATFRGRGPVEAGVFEIEAGQTVTVTCRRSIGTCNTE